MKQSEAQRILLAQTAARLIHENGIRDYRLAKSKAAAQLGIDPSKGALPKNTEIQAALAEYIRLFAGASQPNALHELRSAAKEAMRLFRVFQPRLVGDVLSGLATEHSDVQLHAFADDSESFDLFLQGQGIPYDLIERRVHLHQGGHANYPAFQFTAGSVGFEVVLFSLRERAHAPRSLIDGASMQRATLAQLQALLDLEHTLDS